MTWTRTLSRLVLTFLLGGLSSLAQGAAVIEFGSPMKYLANGSDPGIAGLAWVEEGFDDSQWSDGHYGIGYESDSGAENLIDTLVPAGTASVYTRAYFTVEDASAVVSLYLGADYDDGYIAWINGQFVSRSTQMPAGDPVWDTTAAAHESSNGATPSYLPFKDLSGAGIPALHDGVNVLAIGIWNEALPSSDLVLVPQLLMTAIPPITRMPYLQLGTDTSILIRWRTPTASDSRVRYGPAPGSLTDYVDDPNTTTEHRVTLEGLSPDTVYYYSVGSSAKTLAGDDADHFFRTAPVPGARRPVRIWVLGDSGTADANAAAVRDAYASVASSTYTDVWLMLGDNAYVTGTDREYQWAVFDTYPGFLRQSALWPTFGNHDALSASSATQTGAYYEIFDLPAAAQAGGIPSGTEAYYSFDFGNVHFISLNSEDLPRDPNGPMLTWLVQDLADTTQDWMIAYWHHPPHSKGSHDSDDPSDSGGRMRDMRENVLPILEDWGVDLVLAGHSHSYERSVLLDGHYDVSATLAPAMMLDAGDGRIGGDGAYEKPTAGPAPHEGAVCVVAGSSSQLGGGTLDHPAMSLSLNTHGSVVLDVEGDRLEVGFLDDQAQWRDRFTIVKNAGTRPLAEFTGTPTAGISPLTVDFADLSTTNTSNWSWDFEHDGVVDSTVRDPTHVFTAPGTYTIRMTAANISGSDTELKPGYVCVSAAAPPAVTGLSFALDTATLSWESVSGVHGYDVVKGDLGQLSASSGEFSSAILSCLVNGSKQERTTDAQIPEAGGGFFYLVRSLDTCGVSGTYDGGGMAQAGSRDPGIEASHLTCP
jgi:hypothetical protein